MAIEIERKFLLASESWRDFVVHRTYLTDGLIAATNGRKARVRIAGEVATLTVKTGGDGLVRGEFEYPIPLRDAREMLKNCCGGDILCKWRHYIEHCGMMWEVDEYEDPLSGIVIAEVELQRPDQPVVLPDWVGREVTGDPAFRKMNMLQQRRAIAGSGSSAPN